MDKILISLTVFAAMIATSFWESHVEGPNVWDKKKYGWKLRFKGFVLKSLGVKELVFSAYHFWLWIITFPILIIVLPQVLLGFSLKFTWFLGGVYIIGSVIEDFVYFIVNPYWGLKKWNSKHTPHPWLKIGKFEFPIPYIIGLLLASLLLWLSI